LSSLCGLLLLPTLALPEINLSPANPVVTAGGAVTIMADRPVTVTLSGNGVLSTVSATSIVYTAPGTINPQHMMAGCPILPSDSIFNTRIDALPVDSNSNVWVPNVISQYGLLVSDQWGINVVTNAASMAPQYFHYSTQLNGAEFPIVPPGQLKRESGSYTTDSDNDHHVLTINRQTCQVYETYQDRIVVPGCSNCTAASGWTYGSSSYQQPSSNDGGGTTDAAGLPLAPLTVHLSEIKAGHINHALRVTTCLGCISHIPVWPAVSSTGAGTFAMTPPMGTRIRLRASFDISGYPPASQVVLQALKEYGMFVADVGMMGMVTFASDLSEDPVVYRQIAELPLTPIAANNFEVVDESSLMVSSTSNEVNPANPFVVPANYALLTVTDLGNPANTVNVPVAVQPIGVGTSDPAIVVQAGTQGFSIPYWVTGTTNQDVTWSITPPVGAGTIAPDGTYSAPPTVIGPTKATVTATSIVDNTASTSVDINILPSAPIRVDTGSEAPTVDGSGNTWLADIGIETGSYAALNDNYPAGAWGPNSTQAQTYVYNWGDDITYRLHVPNGTYTVELTLGMGNCSGQYSPTAVWDNGLIWGPLLIETQGQVVLPSWDWGSGINYACRTPSTVSIPAVVTDTNLQVAIRAIGSNSAHSAPILNAITIQPTTTAWQSMFSVSSLQFPDQLVGGMTAAQSASLWNTGNAPLPISAISLGGANTADFTIVGSNCPVTLAVGSSCAVSVIFQPTASGIRSATLNVTDRSVNSPKTIALAGNGVAIPRVSLNTVSLTFVTTSMGNIALAQSATIQNVGNAPLAIAGVSLAGANASDFSVDSSACPTSLAPAARCQVSVTFSPTAMGPRSAALQINDSAVDSPQSISLSGMGIGLAMHLSTSAYAYTMPILLNHQLVPNTDQNNFVILFAGTYPSLATLSHGGSVENANGYDIIFASDPAGNNKLNFEREAYEPTTGTVRYWVQIPTVSHGADTTVYLLYGSASNTDPANSAATWGLSYRSVWHMDETSSTLHDSTGNGNDVQKTIASDPVPTSGDGWLGGAQLFTNTTFAPSPTAGFAQTGLNSSSDISIGTGLTISATLNSTQSNVYAGIYRRTGSASDSVVSAQVALTLNDNSENDITYWVDGASVHFANAITTTVWEHITLTHDFRTGLVSLYDNGVLFGTAILATTPRAAPSYIDVLGNRAYAFTAQNFPGSLQEITLSSSVDSADRIAAEYNSQKYASSMVSVGFTSQPVHIGARGIGPSNHQH
jgi:Domain of unknown function (DUF2341)